MAFDISAGNGVDITLVYNGALDGEPTVFWDLEGGARISSSTYDPTTKAFVFGLEHNGLVGLLSLTVTADGDLGSGIRSIVYQEQFNMLDAGATSVTATVSAERVSPDLTI